MELNVLFEDKQNKVLVRTAMRSAIRRAIFNTLVYEGVEGKFEVSVTFVDNEEIRTLNRAHRSKDAPTDVLSFPMFDFAAGEVPVYPKNESLPLGDVVLSLERARVQAAEIGHSTMREVVFLCIHSTLHLLGYDHELSPDDDEDMQRRQREIMKILGLE